jgi:hypothetical protein
MTITKLKRMIQDFQKAEEIDTNIELDRFHNCIDGFCETVHLEKIEQKHLNRKWQETVQNWNSVYAAHRTIIEAEALDLNIFEVIGFSTEELSHSRVLAWLLNFQENHHQGNKFFRLFLENLRLPEPWADSEYHVKTEYPGKRSRIDIRIYSEGLFAIDIEVKVRSREGYYQLQRESDDAKDFGHSIQAKEIYCYFLSSDGKLPPSPGMFKAISWNEISRLVGVLENDDILPARLRFFMENYQKVLRTISY